jgi:glucosamine--fructose-6-phosphate aminotransferase (isomerizing)
MTRGEHTRREILAQPVAWAEALRVVQANRTALMLIAKQEYQQILFTGCGSTYYLSLAAAALFQALTRRLTRAVPGGELLLNPATVLSGGKTLLVAISRSGATTETVRSVQRFIEGGSGEVITITNDGTKPLAGLASVPLVIESGQEQSVAQTRSFTSMFIAATALAALFAGREDLFSEMHRLPEIGARLMVDHEPAAIKLGENLAFDRFYFLGSGTRYGLACEANLKLKEMALTNSEPFHFLEFRHGPMSMVDPSAVVIGLLSEENYTYEQKVLSEMELLGGTVLGLGESNTTVNFHSLIPESVRNVLYLPVLQLMSYHRSMAKGLDPDRPNNLSAVIELELP